jgi:hypothetical protein
MWEQSRPRSEEIVLETDVPVGSYRIVRPLAASAAARVYLARHALLGRAAVLKVLAKERPAEAEREIVALASVRSRGVPLLLDCGRLPDAYGGVPFVITEYINGEPLSRILQAERRLRSRRAVRLVLQLLLAVDAVHSAGFTHGDIKPDNIIVTGSGTGSERVTLIDFGASQRVDDRAQREGHDTSASTRLRFTPEYAAPEILERAAPSVVSDLFSVGCVLYECIAGRRVEGLGASGPGAHVEPLDLLVPVSSVLSRVAQRALNADPAARFQSARELRAALSALTAHDLAGDCQQAWAALPGQQEFLETLDVGDGSASGPRLKLTSAVWQGDFTRLLSTATPEVWAFTGDPGMDQLAVREAIGEQVNRYKITVLDTDARERKRVDYLSGALPPCVVVFGDLHVLLKEPLLEDLCKQGETARLLVSTHANRALLQSSINECGIDAQLCLPTDAPLLGSLLDRLCAAKRQIRRRYDWLRLALQDSQLDLRTLEQRLARPV